MPMRRALLPSATSSAGREDEKETKARMRGHTHTLIRKAGETGPASKVREKPNWSHVVPPPKVPSTAGSSLSPKHGL